jgi:hypothetical protein
MQNIRLMDKQERNKLRHEVYNLWYNCEDKDEKKIYKDMLKLINYTEQLRANVKSVTKLFAGMM